MVAIVAVTGTVLGALLLGVVSGAVLIPLLAGVLVLSSIEMWRHE